MARSNRVEFGSDAEERAEAEKAFIREPVEKQMQDEPAEKQEAPRVKINKTLRMFSDHSEMLAEQAFKRTRKGAGRVTESDILSEALDDWAKKHKVDLSQYR